MTFSQQWIHGICCAGEVWVLIAAGGLSQLRHVGGGGLKAA